MPQHNKQRSAHFSQIYYIEDRKDYCFCGVCGDLANYLLCTEDNRLFCPSCWIAERREPPIQGYYQYETIGFLLLDTEGKFPHQHQQELFKFGDWKEIFPPNYTAQYVVLYDRYEMELYLFSLKKNGYWMESKDLIRIDSKFFNEFDQVECRVSKREYWKIALECMKMNAKLLKKEKKQFMENQDIELGITYCLNESSFRDDEEFIDFTFSMTERLALRCNYAKQIESQTFQGFMINELRWYLNESGQETKQIYPIVYPLGNGNESLDVSFELKRNWKNFNNSFTKIESCLSGDLNGGYSDKIIYQLGKNGNSVSEDDILKYSPSAIPISNFEYIPSISATRPFHSNPDLFQVYLIFSNIEKRSHLEANKKIGLLFSFQFKIVEEFKLLKERLFERLTRNILTDCKFEFQ